MLALGLNCHALWLFGHLFGAVYVVLMSYPGMDYRISFPVSTRVAWGFCGSVLVVLNRIATSAIFTGVQGWLGGLVTYVCIRAIWPSIDNIHNTLSASTGTNMPQFVGFIVWYTIQVALVALSPQNLCYLVMIGAVVGFVVQLALVSWACSTMGSAGFGTVLSSSVSLSGSQLAWMVVYGMSLTTSSITTGTLSVCDYARFAKGPRRVAAAQFLGAFPAWLANIFGVMTIAATQDRYGAQLWSLPSLLIAMQDADPTPRTRVAVSFAGFGMALLQLGLNITGNSFCGGTDLAALFPRWINIRRGQVLTAAVGVAINPWYLMTSATVFLSAMSSYTVVLQPFLGIMVAEYFIVQKRRLRVTDLYTLVDNASNLYWYTMGLNWRAVVAWVVGAVPHFPGFAKTVNSNLNISLAATRLYYLDSFTGFIIPTEPSFSATILQFEKHG
ncbi:hypothetical protein SCUCBS95973_008963 [Sporothrix curviconia]|uniref:Uncharacterized protein n=1 Tax=Sporothrix curviconia TaxID=1260050 RepID=A0ABP0CQZ7_9PEZI